MKPDEEQFLIDKIQKLSDFIISAERGKFYSYSSEFSRNEPLYFLLDCKANKNRPIETELTHIIQELDLVFNFDNEISICSPASKYSQNLLLNIVNPAVLRDTKIKISKISQGTFYKFFNDKRAEHLIEVYNNSGDSMENTILHEGIILSFKTDNGKIGLLLIKELSSASCKIDACHILL